MRPKKKGRTKSLKSNNKKNQVHSFSDSAAKGLLEKLDFEDTINSRVCFIVGHHHTYTAIDSIDFQILVEADFLINIYEDEISQEAIFKIRDNYFKTDAGTNFLKQMYLP